MYCLLIFRYTKEEFSVLELQIYSDQNSVFRIRFNEFQSQNSLVIARSWMFEQIGIFMNRFN